MILIGVLFWCAFYLEDRLGCQVDWVTEKALRSKLRSLYQRGSNKC